MEKFKRFISYMYMYVDEKKEENIGYTKVIFRDGILNTEVNLRAESLDNSLCEIYLLEGDNLNRILLGSETIKSGKLLAKNYFNVRTHQVNLNEFKGMLITNNGSASVVFATVWTDEEIDLFFKKESVSEEKKIHSEECIEEMSNTTQTQVIEEMENIEQETNVSDEEATWEENVEAQSVPGGNFVNPFEGYEPVNAFCDDKYTNLVEITPKDIEKLPGNLFRLKDNSFMMHGYYNYRHILVGEIKDMPNRMFIGVPGTYHNTEKYIANMFGFYNFKLSHRSDIRIQGFGYWYMEVPV